MSTGLQIDDLSWTVGGLNILRNVSFSVPTGNIYGLVGPNGSGKSSLLNAISGLVAPTNGTILLDGVDGVGESPDKLRRRGIARTFQLLRLLDQETAITNVESGALLTSPDRRLRGLLPSRATRTALHERRKLAIEYLDRVNAAEFGLSVAEDLSYGTRRKVELARALMARPRLLLLDEPTSGVSTAHVSQMLTTFRAAASEGVAILLVDHDLEVIADICNQVIVLDAGEVIFEGLPASAFSDQKVNEAYVGK